MLGKLEGSGYRLLLDENLVCADREGFLLDASADDSTSAAFGLVFGAHMTPAAAFCP
jgi:hypothetical protein